MANDEKHSSSDSCLGCLFGTIVLYGLKVLFLWAMGWLDVVYTWRNLKITGVIFLGMIIFYALTQLYYVIRGRVILMSRMMMQNVRIKKKCETSLNRPRDFYPISI